MKPPKREFEKVEVDAWLNGEISSIEYDTKHEFKESIAPAIKIKISVAGYKFPKSTPWMLFSYAKKSNVYKLFVEPLVEGAYEYMDFDLDQLKGMRVKVMFTAKGEYQNITMVRPLENKVLPNPIFMNQEKASQIDEETPF